MVRWLFHSIFYVIGSFDWVGWDVGFGVGPKNRVGHDAFLWVCLFEQNDKSINRRGIAFVDSIMRQRDCECLAVCMDTAAFAKENRAVLLGSRIYSS